MKISTRKSLLSIAISIVPISNMALAENSSISASEWKSTQNERSSYIGGPQIFASKDGEQTRDYVQGFVFNDVDRDGCKGEEEQGVAGVLVSNGYDVVKTNKNGFYKLPVAKRGLEDFTVFITKPAGWDLPTDEDNIPQFFYHHAPNGSPEMRFGGLDATGDQPRFISFPMIKGEYKKNFKIAVSGDPQPYSNNEVGYVREALANELVGRDDLELVLIEGDVMGDDLGLYPRMKKIMSAVDKPIYFVPGNHDLDFDAPTDANSLDTFKREWGPTYYSFDMGDVHFVVLDNMRYPCTPDIDNADGLHDFCADPENAPTYNGVIDSAQMEWLTNDLSLVPENKLIVLNMHVPLVSYADMDSTKHQVDNTQWLYDLIGDRPALALSGHTHSLENFLPGESFEGWNTALGLGSTPFPQIVTGATSGAWWNGDIDEFNLPMAIQRQGAPRGYLIFEFFGSDFNAQFKAAAKSPREQMHADFLSPTFLDWYYAMKSWYETPAEARTDTPPVSIADLGDTSILTASDLAGGTELMVNVWNGSRDSKVWVKLDDQAPALIERTQSGTGEGKIESLDPFALKKQLYVYRYATKSESGNPDTQGYQLYNGSQYGTADPQPQSGSFAENSNHIWKMSIPADLENGIHTLEIMTRDVYGKYYKTTKTFEVMDERPEPYFRTEVFE